MSSQDIINKIKELLPDDAGISDFAFEGANIVLYSKNKVFAVNSRELTRKIVNNIKKRVEIRPDEVLLEDTNFTETFIRKIIPKSAGLEDLWFDEKRSIVILEVEKPSEVINKTGKMLRDITEKTCWVPIVRRKPAIKSDIIRNIRLTLYKNSIFRRKFLNKIGERVYSNWERDKKYWVRVSCLGGFREVGRSCLLLQTPESQVMVDCGINIASDEYAYPYLDAPEFDPKNLDAVIISHAHLDHCGFLPYLFNYGFEGPVYCSEPTRDIMTLMQLDYIDIAEKENKKLLYNSKDVKKLVKHIVTLNFGEVTDITPDFRLTLFNAGHILGSSMVHLNIGNGYHNLLYTGDYKFSSTQLLGPAVSRFQRVETLISESTYGGVNDVQPSKEDSEAFLSRIIQETVKRKGKVLIPVLGVGRAQEVIVLIDRMMRKNQLPDIPVFVDGMVWDITAIHTAYPELFNNDIKQLIFKEHHNPFLNPVFKQPGSQAERMKIVEEEGPCVILATSGMLTGGPSVFYLEHLADNPRNSMVFVSYQGKGSLGRIIQRGDKEVILRVNSNKREMLPIKLEVYTIEGLSGHSDRNQLMNFISRLVPRPKRVIIDHGEQTNCLDLASSVYKRMKIETLAPRNLDCIRLA
ncbi:beta-CASP ribonuclease aCPSF1 [archaeon CG06_land_8_20_14_3_00_37_11]|nr:MAG: beta-CASP ribonuclease aCPSF1 [archaeon CG06_land_8_20_14_3_00_37_11]